MTDATSAQKPLSEEVAEAVAGGVDWVQVRDRGLGGAALMQRVAEIREAALRVRSDVRVLVNRRADVALAVSADGVHLGFDALEPGDVRELPRRWALIGVSCHSPAEVAAAHAAGADYAHLAPIFDPLSKARERPALGLAALRKAAACDLPVLAQGGIHADNAAQALEAGAAGVAVTGALLGASDPRAAAERLRRALG